MHHVLHETPGAEVALIILALVEDRIGGKYIMTHLITAGPTVMFKYAIGTTVRKEWNGRLYSGEVINCGVDRDTNTYKIHYAEDNDTEILVEEELKDIVVKACNTMNSK